MVNHDPKLAVDTPCSNLAIKYNMLYLSVHQLIRKHIHENTEFGERLLKARSQRSLSTAFHQVSMVDKHDEMQYTAVHFDIHLIMELLQQTIAEKRTNQRFILIEGLCNGQKLANEEDQLTLRYMDELFLIEKALGEVTAVASLTYTKEELVHESQVKYEEFPEEEVVEVKAPELDEDGNPIEVEAEAAEEDDPENPKKVPFNPKESPNGWTVTDRKSKNLLTLFTNMKGINNQNEIKEAEGYGKDNNVATVTASLDDFCTRITEENSNRNLYMQVIFEK